MNWLRSSKCDTGTCVWVSLGHATVWVRDAAGQTLVMSHADWRGVLRGVGRA